MGRFLILAAALAIAAGQTYIGRVDTIGGTTHDWWASANVHRSIVNSPQSGIHAVWMYSSDMSNTTFPDRNMRYHFYDYSTRQWNWPDPDYMQSGVNVFAERTGYGVIDADSAGKAAIAAHDGSGLVIARDAASGAGIFSYSGTLPGYYWPDMVIGDDGTYHVAMSTLDYVLSYGRIRPGHGWDSIRPLDSTAFPAYAIASGKTAPSVCVVWSVNTSAFFMLSENRGDTWSAKVELDPPPAFGGDTATRFSMHGLFPFFDSRGRLHIAAAVYPEVHDTGYVNSAEIWHWCPANQPHWAEIHRAGCAPEHLQASVGYNAIYADRPSMGEGNDGRLFVAWEQFDSSNVEPQTERLRAGVWISGSANNGMTWAPGLLVTERNTLSHRFPCIIDRMVGSPSEDTICLLYLMDQVAGFFIYNEGLATANPVVCQFIPSTYVGIAENRKPQASSFKPRATIVRGVLELRGLGTRAGLADNPVMSRAVLLDAAGREVLELHPGANDVSRFAPGVYFVVTSSPSSSPPEGERAGVRGSPASGVVRDASCVSKVLVVR